MSDSIVNKVQDAELENPRLHKCAEMPSTGVHVQYGHNLLGRPLCWSLYLIREATEELESTVFYYAALPQNVALLRS